MKLKINSQLCKDLCVVSPGSGVFLDLQQPAPYAFFCKLLSDIFAYHDQVLEAVDTSTSGTGFRYHITKCGSIKRLQYWLPLAGMGDNAAPKNRPDRFREVNFVRVAVFRADVVGGISIPHLKEMSSFFGWTDAIQRTASQHIIDLSFFYYSLPGPHQGGVKTSSCEGWECRPVSGRPNCWRSTTRFSALHSTGRERLQYGRLSCRAEASMAQ